MARWFFGASFVDAPKAYKKGLNWSKSDSAWWAKNGYRWVGDRKTGIGGWTK